MRWTWVCVLLWPSWAGASQPSVSSDVSWGVSAAWGVLCLGIVVLGVTRWRRARQPDAEQVLQLRGRLPLGPRREIVVVEAAGTTLICACTEHGIHALATAPSSGGPNA